MADFGKPRHPEWASVINHPHFHDFQQNFQSQVSQSNFEHFDRKFHECHYCASGSEHGLFHIKR